MPISLRSSTREAPPPLDDDRDGATELGRDRSETWFLVALIAAITPILVAAIRALANDWTAVGDNGYFLLRARDVLTEHAPQLGTWSSSSQVFGFEVNNPGPLHFYLLSVPAKLWADAGLVVAVAAMAIASILGIAFALRRNAGPGVASVGLVATGGLAWSMGPPMLVDPWQPHSLLFPFLAFLVLAWTTAAGDARTLPWAVGVGSLLVQTHLSYVYVVPAAGVTAVAGLALGAVSLRRDAPDRFAPRRRELVRAGSIAVVVGVVCWLPSLAEQVRGAGRGNLSRLLDAATAGAPTVGADIGIRRSAQVLALWPTWLRPSFEEQHLLDAPPGFATGLVALVVAAGLVVSAGWWAWRRGDRFALAGAAVAGVSGCAAVYTASGLIDSPFGVAAHHVRYLWPLAAMLQLSIAVVVVRSLGAGALRWVGMGAAVLVVVLAIANLPDVERPSGPNSELATGPAIRAMNDQLGPLEDRGTVLVDFSSFRAFNEPFSGPMLAELGGRGIPFVVDDAGEIRQVGSSRAYRGEADARVFLRWGVAAMSEQPDAERVAFASLLDDSEIETWSRIRAALVDAVEAGDVELTSAGRAALERGDLDAVLHDDELDVRRPLFLVESAAFLQGLEEGWIRVPSVDESSLDTWIDLHPTLVEATVSVWVTEWPEPEGS